MERPQDQDFDDICKEYQNLIYLSLQQLNKPFLEEYIQAGRIGLWNASRTYRPTGTFVNYAFRCIKNAILKEALILEKYTAQRISYLDDFSELIPVVKDWHEEQLEFMEEHGIRDRDFFFMGDIKEDSELSHPQTTQLEFNFWRFQQDCAASIAAAALAT